MQATTVYRVRDTTMVIKYYITNYAIEYSTRKTTEKSPTAICKINALFKRNQMLYQRCRTLLCVIE